MWDGLWGAGGIELERAELQGIRFPRVFFYTTLDPKPEIRTLEWRCQVRCRALGL